MSILIASLPKVFQKLENTGWDTDDEEGPTVPYDLVLSIIAKQSGRPVPAVFYEFINPKLTDDTPLE
ncbi:hypothetical protein ANO14919_034750 [Xylariales sp. No.14919]|nr:hypothetical protein ANO14919_034750 [Xylariales sp. No.14919]